MFLSYFWFLCGTGNQADAQPKAGGEKREEKALRRESLVNGGDEGGGEENVAISCPMLLNLAANHAMWAKAIDQLEAEPSVC